MDEYTFTCDGHSYTVTRVPAAPASVASGGPWPEGGRITSGPVEYENVSAACLEILRLAERLEVNERETGERIVALLCEREKAMTAVIGERDRLASRIRELEGVP